MTHIRNTFEINTGDTVFADFSRYGRTDVRKGTVAGKSATGVLRVRFEIGNITVLFNNNGQERGAADKWNKAQLITEDNYKNLRAIQSVKAAESTVRKMIGELQSIPISDRERLKTKLRQALAAAELLPE